MGNKIQIKHGTKKPLPTDLGEYELGYSTEDEIVYFNNGSEIVPISGDYVLKYVNNIDDVTSPNIAYIVPSEGDTQQQKGYDVASTAPTDTTKLWIDTSSDYASLKFYDASNDTWKNINAVFA